jgi:hypothetical protein
VSGQSISPMTSFDHPCSDLNYKLEIDTTTAGAYCFYGSGYMGLGDPGGPGDLFQVFQVRSLPFALLGGGTSNGSGWIVYYDPPFAAGTGHQFSFCRGSTYGSPAFDGDEKVTQVNLN